MRIVLGDITSVRFGIIVHGCNAQGVMGSGVAEALRDKYPQIYDDYRQRYENNSLNLGDIVTTQIDDRLLVVSLISQENYGKDGKKYASLFAIQTGLEKILYMRENSKFHLEPIVLPRIGAGLGGLDWVNVENMLLALEKRYNNLEFTVCVL